MKFLYYFRIFSFLYSSVLFSQTVEPSSVVERELLQLEMGVDYAVAHDGTENQLSWSLPSMLCRYGAYKNIELQFSVPLVREQLFEETYKIDDVSQIQNIQIGAAVNLCNQHKILPQVAFMTRISMPLKIEAEYTTVGKTIALNCSNVFLKKWSLNYNIGYISALDGTKTGYHVLNISYNLNDKIHFFIENFSEFCAATPCTQNINMGGGFVLCRNMCMDFSVAKGINYDLFYTGALVTWLIDTKHKIHK